MTLSKSTQEYRDFIRLRDKLEIACDGEAHIISTHILGGNSLEQITKTWNEITQSNSELFDNHKGIKAELVWENAFDLQAKLNKLFAKLGIRIKFMSTPATAEALLQQLKNQSRTANLTVKILDEQPQGHVVTIWWQGRYLIHDPNLSRIQEITETQINQLLVAQVELEQGYNLTYDFDFSIEIIEKAESKQL